MVSLYVTGRENDASFADRENHLTPSLAHSEVTKIAGRLLLANAVQLKNT